MVISYCNAQAQPNYIIHPICSHISNKALAIFFTGDGGRREQGESPRDENKLMSPEYVAKWILKGIKKKKCNKILTWEGRFTALFQRIIPHTVDRAYYNALSKRKNSPLK
jgi:short-subunit dehydrogenase